MNEASENSILESIKSGSLRVRHSTFTAQFAVSTFQEVEARVGVTLLTLALQAATKKAEVASKKAFDGSKPMVTVFRASPAAPEAGALWPAKIPSTDGRTHNGDRNEQARPNEGFAGRQISETMPLAAPSDPPNQSLSREASPDVQVCLWALCCTSLN
jgi:hypothetical protein